MSIIRNIVLVLVLITTLGGCTIIRGTAAGPAGDAWYVRAGYYTGKVKGIYYCPADQLGCQQAAIVSREEFQKLTAKKVSGGEQDAAF